MCYNQFKKIKLRVENCVSPERHTLASRTKYSTLILSKASQYEGTESLKK